MNSELFTKENEDKMVDAIKLETERAEAERQNPYLQAAVRLLTNNPEPTIEQVQHELNNL